MFVVLTVVGLIALVVVVAVVLMSRGRGPQPRHDVDVTNTKPAQRPHRAGDVPTRRRPDRSPVPGSRHHRATHGKP